MGVVYHGSKNHNIKRLEPRKSTHGTYVYATPEKVLAIHFSGRCGDDLTYDIGRFGIDKSEPWQLVEKIPGALEKMYNNSSSIYTFQDDTFKNIHTGFEEVVSEVGVDVVEEEYIDNVYEAILRCEQEGLLTIYRYPNRPLGMPEDHSDILDKWRYYKEVLNHEFTKGEFDRLFYLHPRLMDKINDVLKDFGFEHTYKKEDIIDLFKEGIRRQLHDMNHEMYVDCAYKSICETFPEFEDIITEIYNNYLEVLNVSEQKNYRW